MVVTRVIRKFFNAFGYEIMKLQNLSGELSIGKWIEKLNIDTIIDVGSNEGQFINSIRNILPNKRIIAFEPIKAVYDRLLVNTKGLNIVVHNCGLSDVAGSAEINISKNFVSSSILQMEELHQKTYPDSQYVNKETIQLKRLDDVVNLKENYGHILLKIDVQGYENKVIAGGTNVIKAVDIVIIEFSFQPIYEGQWLFGDTYHYFIGNGFKFIGFADQVADPVIGIPIYGDAIFIKENLAKKLYS